jgi:translation elongation factor EF-Tu-like GTPase
LASEALAILSDSQLSSKVENELVGLLNKYDLRTQGIIKGRDITRLAVQAKDKKIAELQTRISVLEGERETNRTVITHLKHDIATSPTKGRGRGRFPARRSEV